MLFGGSQVLEPNAFVSGIKFFSAVSAVVCDSCLATLLSSSTVSSSCFLGVELVATMEFKAEILFLLQQMSSDKCLRN